MNIFRRITLGPASVINNWRNAKRYIAWKQWMDSARREPSDLKKLLVSTDASKDFKKRALFLLLVPSTNLNKFYWEDVFGSLGKFYWKSSFLATLSTELLIYAADLIAEFKKTLDPSKEANHDALYFYNDCILNLLSRLPLKQAGIIFPLYSLRDFSIWEISMNSDDESGYNPFAELLWNENVDEQWKKLADNKMRQIIKDEIDGKTQPRKSWENALSCYCKTVRILNGKHYSIKLQQSQIQFINEMHSHSESFK